MYSLRRQSQVQCQVLKLDLNSPFHDRNWELDKGTWKQDTNPENGNIMIRAVINNEISAPAIKTQQDNTYTNQAKVQVKGTAIPTIQVQGK
ncbi:hypothetical protein ACIQAA_31005 [Neobacillus sp. NPDC093182]|uniref:hypothetical protein n=1 Tax=Neobacillus sp. NPDC093182 TaxID=3364297 RepID=UPI00381AB35F